MRFAGHFRNLAVRQQFDIFGLFDALRQIIRHIFPQIAAANQKKNLSHVLREINRRLSGGIAAADHANLFAAAHFRFHLRRRVIYARAVEFFASGNVEFAIFPRRSQSKAIWRKPFRRRRDAEREICRRNPSSKPLTKRTFPRRISAPEWWRGRLVPRRKVRLGSRDNFRFWNSFPPVRRARCLLKRWFLNLPTRRKPPPRIPPDRRRRSPSHKFSCRRVCA